MASAQSRLVRDTAQAHLWAQAGQSGAAAAVRALAETGLVRTGVAVRVPDRRVQAVEQPFSRTVDAALLVLSVPEIEGSFAGAATVRAATGEFVTLDLGDHRSLRLQAKVGGGPIRARVGETGQMTLRLSGSPYERNDVLTLRLADDELVHALVGGAQPVRFRTAAPAIDAAQTGEAKGNTMEVAVTVGSDRRILRQGEQADFSKGGLTVKVLASTAIQGEAAHAVEGDPYRIELLAWRTRQR